jgi:hypothetical protein
MPMHGKAWCIIFIFLWGDRPPSLPHFGSDREHRSELGADSHYREWHNLAGRSDVLLNGLCKP